tara:strand:- start:52 stop:933 length:882 start_codon:yes stop_codon:yes gene_type:complete
MADFLELMVSVGEAGSIYALVALAYQVVLRPTGIINFAVGEWAALGAFAAVSFITWWKLPLIAGLPLCIAVVGAVGWITEVLTVQPLLKREAPELSPVLTLLGMLIIYRETVSSVYGVDNLFVPMPFGFGRIEIGPFAGTSQSFFILLVSAITFFLIWLFFERTVWGKAFQAVAINRTAAAVLGINLRLVTALSFALGGGIAGLAGVLQAPITSVHFLMGLPLAIKGFSALVIGGVGRIEGALLGGLLLAFVEKITIRYAPIPSGMALGAPFLLLILFLLMRPSGLMRARGEQ